MAALGVQPGKRKEHAAAGEASGGLISQFEDGVAVGQVPVVLHAVLLEVFACKALRRAHLELHLPEAAGLHRALVGDIKNRKFEVRASNKRFS